jgi:hypothetical protein
MEMLIIGLEMLRRLLPRVGPYLLVEIVLPGGTLVALMMYLYQRWNSSIERDLPLSECAVVASAAGQAETQ